MDVELYVYDLSGGLARQYSMAIAGIQIDAIYHTAIVFGGVEYFFGQGVHRKVPGSTHHGRPMKIVPMGRTELPAEVVEEYLESLEAVYTPESYDLFLHNCNNFSQDLAVFLVGKSIPDEIRNLPETFLRTPIGQMLRGQLDQSMRRMTQAPDAVAGQSVKRPAVTNGTAKPGSSTNGNHMTTKLAAALFANATNVQSQPGHVHYPKSTTELDKLLKQAENSCACIFFTSATCPPCKTVYPVYDELAAESGDKAILIKVDVGQVYDIARRYQVRATPTFMTFLKGQKDQEWSGANGPQLKGNIRLLVQMAHPQHAHARLRLPSLQHKIEKPIIYAKVPPLEKLLAKIGAPAEDKPVQDLVNYIRLREKNGLQDTAVPNLHSFTDWFSTKSPTLPMAIHFAIIDLVRIAATDSRVSSFLAAESGLRTLQLIVPENRDFSTAPYNLQAVTLQLFCNLFSSPVFQDALLNHTSPLRTMLNQLVSQCLLAEHNNARSLAAALIYDLAAYDHNERVDGKGDKLDVSSMGDLEAALVQAVVSEEANKETLRSLLLALGLLLYAGPAGSEIWELCQAMEVREALKAKSKIDVFKGEPLLKEVGEELLGKGG